MWIELTEARHSSRKDGPDRHVWVNMAQMQSMHREPDGGQWRPHTVLWPHGSTYQDVIRVAEAPYEIYARIKEST